MDLPSIIELTRPRCRADLPPPARGRTYLAGGTWLFSEPQSHLHALVDLAGLGWPALVPSPDGLSIAATCTIGALEAYTAPVQWTAAPVIAACCRALLGSFKIAGVATVGGNICLALPASPMLALTVALDGVALVWMPGGGDRRVSMAEFALGPQLTVLAPGELLRAVDLPATALHRRAGVRQASLTRHGRSAALLVATLDQGGAFVLTLTAATRRPVQFRWPNPPGCAALDAAVAALPADLWYDDVHGAPAWRRQMSRRLAGELRAELLA